MHLLHSRCPQAWVQEQGANGFADMSFDALCRDSQVGQMPCCLQPLVHSPAAAASAFESVLATATVAASFAVRAQ